MITNATVDNTVIVGIPTGVLKGSAGVIVAATSGTDYEPALTFSTGLTRTTNTITCNLSVGVTTGQSVIGGANASATLTLSSTAHATKGKILFGTSAYDEVNNRLGIGTASPGVDLDVSRANSGSNVISRTYNSDSSGSSNARHQVQVGGTSAGDPFMLFTGDGGVADISAGMDNSDTDAYVISVGVTVPTTTSNVLRGRQNKDIHLGGAATDNALATNATAGFVFLPTCAGTPTGTPASIPTGGAPVVINTTNNKLYFYSTGAWRDAGP